MKQVIPNIILVNLRQGDSFEITHKRLETGDVYPCRVFGILLQLQFLQIILGAVTRAISGLWMLSPFEVF